VEGRWKNERFHAEKDARINQVIRQIKNGSKMGFLVVILLKGISTLTDLFGGG
jgi:hypothetical protein